jgi:ATP-binding cassette, subfamily C (CFTR/MRP), member 1
MAWKGYKKPLETKDLWDLNDEDKSRAVVPTFDKFWSAKLRKNIESGDRKKTVSLLAVLLQTLGLTFFLGSLLKVIPDLLVFVSPQILKYFGNMNHSNSKKTLPKS